MSFLLLLSCCSVLIFTWLVCLLLSGFVYYAIMYARYRNQNARHTYETDTKTNMSNLRKTDNFIQSKKGLTNAYMNGANNKNVNGMTSSKRIIEAKKVHQRLSELSGYYIVKNTMDCLNSTLEYDEIAKLITNCASSCNGINKKLKSGKSEFDALISSFSKLSEDKLSLDVLQHIDKKINDILSLAYISFLNDNKKYQSLSNVYSEEKPNFMRELSKYKKKVEKIKKMILHNLYLN